MTGRIARQPGFQDLVDTLATGGTAEWRALYARAKTDAALRREIREALEFVNPEIGSARQLWMFLLGRIEQIDRLQAPHPRVT